MRRVRRVCSNHGLYRAASALLAADHEKTPQPEAQRALRDLAFTWLKHEVDTWQTWRGKTHDSARQMGRVSRLALTSPDLASVHGKAIARLPVSEQERWQKLWDSVEEMAAGNRRK